MSESTEQEQSLRNSRWERGGKNQRKGQEFPNGTRSTRVGGGRGHSMRRRRVRCAIVRGAVLVCVERAHTTNGLANDGPEQDQSLGVRPDNYGLFEAMERPDSPRCEMFCHNPCEELTGDFTLECGACPPHMACSPRCSARCHSPCAELNGHVAFECGSCQVQVACHPGAVGWPATSTAASSTAALATAAPASPSADTGRASGEHTSGQPANVPDASCYASGSMFASIRRMHWSDMTPELVRDHVIRRCPLIITGLAPTGSSRWSFQRLREECGSAQVDLANHYHVPLKHIDTHWPALLRPLVDRYLHPWSLQGLLHELDRKWDVGGILESFMREGLYRGSYAGLGDYIWPPTLRSVRLEELGCEPLITAASEVQTLLRSFFHSRSPSGRPYVREPGRPPHRPGQGWEAFVAPNATRAYPMHQHGTMNENLIVVLSGTKQVFIFPPSADGDLRERPEVAQSEYGDRIFTSRPEDVVSMVPGAAGAIGAGEALYIPANTIHLLENFGDMIAVAMHSKADQVEHIAERDASGAWRPTHMRSVIRRVAASVASGTVIWDAFGRAAQQVRWLGGVLYHEANPVPWLLPSLMTTDAVIPSCTDRSSVLCGDDPSQSLLVDSSDPSKPLPAWAGLVLSSWRSLAAEWRTVPRELFLPYCHHQSDCDNPSWRIFPLIVLTERVRHFLLLAPAATALVDSLSAALGPALLNVCLSLAQSEGHIKPHCGGHEGKTFTRYHMVLDVPQPAAEFRICARAPFTFREGVLFAFNNSQPHEVFNGASAPRVVLMFDVMHSRIAGDAVAREASLAPLRHIWRNSLERVAQMNAAPSLESVIGAAIRPSTEHDET